jgi:hypothetical protein
MLYAIEKYRSLPFLLARCFHYYLRATGVNIVLRVSSHVLQINKETSLSYSELNLRAIHSLRVQIRTFPILEALLYTKLDTKVSFSLKRFVFPALRKKKYLKTQITHRASSRRCVICGQYLTKYT